jgi:hypothetical protein
MIDTVQRNRCVKAALVKVFGKGNVSVRNGTGTAYGWCKIYIHQRRPTDCGFPEVAGCRWCPWSGCSLVKESYHQVMERAKRIISGYKFYDYCDDMGYNHKEVTTFVEFV